MEIRSLLFSTSGHYFCKHHPNLREGASLVSFYFIHQAYTDSHCPGPPPRYRLHSCLDSDAASRNATVKTSLLMSDHSLEIFADMSAPFTAYQLLLPSWSAPSAMGAFSCISHSARKVIIYFVILCLQNVLSIASL